MRFISDLIIIQLWKKHNDNHSFIIELIILALKLFLMFWIGLNILMVNKLLVNYHIFKNRLPLMNSALDSYSLRQRVIAKNIANVDSPHYRPESVKFEELFRNQELTLEGSTNDKYHIPLGEKNKDYAEGEVNPQEVPSPQVYFSGENHVNIDKEMSNMAQNQIRYRFATQMVSKFFSGIQSAIQGQVVGK